MAGRNVELHMLCGKLIPYLLQCKLRHLHVICMAQPVRLCSSTCVVHRASVLSGSSLRGMSLLLQTFYMRKLGLQCMPLLVSDKLQTTDTYTIPHP